MADGDKLTLGELRNSATSMTRLVGNVDGRNACSGFSRKTPSMLTRQSWPSARRGEVQFRAYGGASASDKGGVGWRVRAEGRP